MNLPKRYDNLDRTPIFIGTILMTIFMIILRIENQISPDMIICYLFELGLGIFVGLKVGILSVFYKENKRK